MTDVFNTHKAYNTVEHEHLDMLVDRASGNYPSSGLLVVGCADGRWFVEVDFGNDYNQIDGIAKPRLTPFVEPRFFLNEEAATDFAIECIKVVHPELRDKDLHALLVE